jgi:hypothetical protein
MPQFLSLCSSFYLYTAFFNELLIYQKKIKNSTFFFDKSKYYIKKHKGAQPLIHWEYTKGTREREKKERKSTKLIARGASQPVVQEKRVTRKKWRSSSRVLETSIISLPPNAPQNTMRDHLPNNSASRTTRRPPTR